MQFASQDQDTREANPGSCSGRMCTPMFGFQAWLPVTLGEIGRACCQRSWLRQRRCELVIPRLTPDDFVESTRLNPLRRKNTRKIGICVGFDVFLEWIPDVTEEVNTAKALQHFVEAPEVKGEMTEHEMDLGAGSHATTVWLARGQVDILLGPLEDAAVVQNVSVLADDVFLEVIPVLTEEVNTVKALQLSWRLRE